MMKLFNCLSISIILVVFFSLLFVAPMLRSGIVTEQGLRLIGVNGSDGLWNLALIEELQHHFPPDHPAFAGFRLQAYHFLYHFSLAIASKLTGISAITLYFHIAPIIISFAWGFGVFFFVLERFKSKKAALWSVFLSFFGGSFAFIFHFIGRTELSLDSAFGVAQPYGSSLVNPAFASSIVLVIWSLYGLQRFASTNKYKWLILAVIFSGISVGFKTYAGMILMGSFVTTALWRVIKDKNTDMLIAFIGSLAISLLVFLPFSGNYGFLTYAPLWPLHRLMQGTLNFTRWDELWEMDIASKDMVGLMKLDLWAFTVFFFGNIGSRIVTFVPLINWLRKAGKGIATKIMAISLVDIHLFSMIVISFGIPLFFLQPTGGGFNMIQMYWYFLFLLALIAGYGIEALLSTFRNNVYRYVLYILFVVSIIPSNIPVVFGDLQSAGSYIDNDSLALYAQLRTIQGYDKTVLEIPSISDYKHDSLDDWFRRSKPIIPAFAGKRAYIADEVVSFPYEDKERRLGIIEQLMLPSRLCANERVIHDECEKALTNSGKLLKQERIRLILTDQPIWWLDKWEQVRVLFRNSRGTIYEVLPL